MLRLVALLTAGILMAAPAAAAPADAAAEELLAAARAARPGSSAPLPRHPLAAIRLLAGTDQLPTDDLTPLIVQALADPDTLDRASREALDILLERPSLPGALSLIRGPFAVHYASCGTRDAPALGDRNGDGIPDLASRALEGLQAARLEAELLGLRTALDDGDGRFDLYLTSLGGQVAGYTSPLRAVRSEETPGWAAFTVLNASSFSDALAAQAMAARLYARAVGFAYRPLAPSWWAEPAALWLEERAVDSGLRYEGDITLRRLRPERGLQVRQLVQTRGNLDFLRTLDARDDGRWVQTVWESAAIHPDLPMIEVLDLATRGSGVPGSGLDRLLADLNARALAEGHRGDGPPLGLAARHDTYPVAAIETVPSVEPLGTSVVLFEADDEEGGLRLRLEGSEPGPWSADVLLRSRQGQDFIRTSLPLDGAGRGEIGLPWADFDQAILLVRHLSVSGPPASFTYTAMPEPHYPFVLTAMGVQEGEDGQRMVFWETTAERDLFGWLVLRGVSPRGPWAPLTRFPLPALGGGEGATAYQLVDDVPAAPGEEAFYRVVAVTLDGLTRTTEAALLQP